MNTASKLKICNRWLEVAIVLILASGIQLEVSSGKYEWSVWAHIALGLILTVLSLYHIYLHYRTSNWFSRFAGNRNVTTRILWWLFLLTVLSGIVASVHWRGTCCHSMPGAVHGKIGFAMALAAIIHFVQKHQKRPKR